MSSVAARALHSSKRFFEDSPETPTSSQASKRIRHSGRCTEGPVVFQASPSSVSVLLSLFPDMEDHVRKRANKTVFGDKKLIPQGCFSVGRNFGAG
jgi:hypothetical protein